ncbi:cagE, TrbE, VirB, component of type IV transporter system family protein [Neorickettsia helminthoeca str. Oregon]|uniref:CagE, TrbE, VirB, component of type IV transporter system family protein n=1 Tax=Neorickettsia helminthoeca str. Oregon TaxID=1286528 RepID=X5HMG6_9RICK|nr:hypothetical protein [Neorickettsia helminthoeca]AHX11660.1 cagE, TrbE, VirB, component of type IV transporter system family protein [Neorickettsia helminthoeca str. Oregon]
MITQLPKWRVSENIPFSCFYDSRTVLNTNGTLVRVVRFRDMRFTAELLVRVQNLLASVVSSEKYRCSAVWINTMRCPAKPVNIHRVATDDFATDFSKAYSKLISERNQFSNELYISIVSEPIIGDTLGSFYFLLKTLIQKIQKVSSQIIVDALDAATEFICTELSDFEAAPLAEDELLYFFSSLLGVGKVNMESSVRDIAVDLLSDRKIFFGFNTFEIQGKTKLFGTSFRVKSFRNPSSPEFIGEVLGISCRMIITEVITAATAGAVKSKFEEGIELMKVVKDEKYLDASCKSKIAAQFADGKFENFCRRSFDVTIFSESADGLSSSIEECGRVFIKHGFIIVRDDLLLEDVFWQKLPGSFPGTRKWEIVLLEDCALFACTHAHFLSAPCNSKNYLTSFISSCGELHRFNFYSEPKLGHTVIFGKKKSGKTALQNFFLLESLIKFSTEFLIIDDQSLSEVFVRAFDGQYLDVAMDSSSGFGCNLLDIEDKDVLAGILRRFCTSADAQNKVKEIAEKLIKIPSNKRTLENCGEALQAILGNLDVIKQRFAHFFDGSATRNLFVKDSVGISLEGVLSSDNIASVLVFYLLNKYLELHMQSRRPFIIAIQNPARFKKLFLSVSECESFLQAVAANGGVVLFSSDTPIFIKELAEIGKRYIPTKILVPSDGNFEPEYRSIFDISSSVLRMLDDALLYDRCFFLKQGEESIILKFDISAFEERYVLSSQGRIDEMRAALKEGGDNPNIWLPLFYRRCK